MGIWQSAIGNLRPSFEGGRHSDGPRSTVAGGLVVGRGTWAAAGRSFFAAALGCCLAAAMCFAPASAGAQKKAAAPPHHATVSPWDVEAREYLGTPESEAAVTSGLAFLASHQQADGHWSSGGA